MQTHLYKLRILPPFHRFIHLTVEEKQKQRKEIRKMKLVLAAALFMINLLILVSSSVGAPPPPPPPLPPPPSPDFNYLVLQWPPSVCNLNPKFCRKAAVKEEFTIHGMWPQKTTNPMSIVLFKLHSKEQW